MSQQPVVRVAYDVPRARPGWELSEETMPESVIHDSAVELLKALLVAWAARVGSTFVVRNLALRWEEAKPRIGIDPDVAVLRPPPPNAAELRSLRTWEPGHVAPMLAVEVVSETNAEKDYAISPEKYAASGVGELWIFDPLLAGPTAHGGPSLLQIWHRREGRFDRIYAGDGPARSPALSAYLVPTDEHRKLRIADSADGTGLWLTLEEAERAARDAERAAKEAERAAKEAALARIAELEAELAKRR